MVFRKPLNFSMFLKLPLHIFNGFWGDHHHWFFLAVWPLPSMVFQWVFIFLPSLSMVFDGYGPLVKRCNGFDGSLWSTCDIFCDRCDLIPHSNNCHQSHHSSYVQVVVEGRCVLKKWVLLQIVIGRYGYKSSFGANKHRFWPGPVDVWCLNHLEDCPHLLHGPVGVQPSVNKMYQKILNA